MKQNTHQSTNPKTRRGFTIIEISLTLAFVSALLISVALVISNIMSIYQKGLTLKAVNSVGRNLVEELTTSINSAPSVDTENLCRSYAGNLESCRRDNASNFIYQSRESDNKQYGGVFCTGNYSYIWNTHYGLESSGKKLQLEYLDQDGNTKLMPESFSGDDAIRYGLIRFEDPTYLACRVSVDSNYNITSNFQNDSLYKVDIKYLNNNGLQNRLTNPPEFNFLEDFDLPLSLYEFTIFPLSQDIITLRSFFSGTFILATERGGVNIQRTDDYCSIQIENDDGSIAGANTLDLGSDFNYCAINKFNFAARTAGV